MAEPMPFAYPGFEGRGLALRPMGFFSAAGIVADGKPAPRKGRSFTVADNQGAPVIFQLRGNLLDPIPAVVVGDQTIRLARPFAWYEYILVLLPMALLFVGGLLGGLCGGVAVLINARLLRGGEPAAIRYSLSLVVIVAAVVVAAGVVWRVVSVVAGGGSARIAAAASSASTAADTSSQSRPRTRTSGILPCRARRR